MFGSSWLVSLGRKVANRLRYKPKYTTHLFNNDVTVDNYCLYNDCLLCKKSKWGSWKIKLGGLGEFPGLHNCLKFSPPCQCHSASSVCHDSPFPFSKLYPTLLVKGSLCSSAARANRRIPQTRLHPCFHLIQTT